jgi:NitT/TauT family transport system substrate-binding protein
VATTGPVGAGDDAETQTDADAEAGASGDDADGAGDATAADEDLPTFVMGGASASLSYTVPQLVVTLGLDREHGFELDYRPTGTSSVNLVSGVLSGDYDFAVPATNTALEAMREGADLLVVAGALEIASILVVRPEVAEGFDVGLDAPIEERVQALEGLNIVTSTEGSGNNTFLRLLLASYGLDPNNDVTITGVNETSAIISGLRQGRFDAAFYGSGVLEHNIADDTAQLWVSAPQGEAEIFQDLVGAIVVTQPSMLEENPEMVRAVHAAFADAIQAIADRPDEVGEALHADWFEELPDDVWQIAWDEAQYAYPDGATFSRSNLDKLTGILERALGNDYSGLVYEDIVLEDAQG